MAFAISYGSLSFNATAVEISGYPRALNIAYNALSNEPVITTSAVSGFGQVHISGQFVGTGETPAARQASLSALGSALQAVVDEEQTTLTVNGDGYRAFRSDQYTVSYSTDEWGAGVVSFDVTVNVLPSSTLPYPDS